MTDVRIATIGRQGPQGIQGPPGVGATTGGTTGQILRKRSSADYDAAFADPNFDSVGTAATAVAAHEAAHDPHPQYLSETEADATYQPVDPKLTSLAGLTAAANKLPYFTSTTDAAVTDITTAGRALLSGSDATAQRGTLGLGTAAQANTGDFAAASHTHLASNITDFNTATDARITLQKGVVNGVATLDSGGKVPTAQLPSTAFGALNYKGSWNATTNSPHLAGGVGTQGDYYVVSVAGATTIDGVSSWAIKDWIAFNGSTWDKINNTETVTSVNGATGDVTLTTATVSEVTNLYFTTERAQDAVGAALIDTATIDLTYDDAGNQISADVKNSSISTSKLGGDVTTAGKALLDDADAATQRTTLGLGTAAVSDSSAFDASGTASSAITAHEAASNPHPVYLTQTEGDGRYILLGVLAEGAYLSTMTTANTGSQNATALTADISAAAGNLIIVPPGTYTLNAVDVSSATVKLRFVQSAKIVPDVALSRSGTMLHTSNCTVELYNYTADGQNNGSPICYRQDGGTFKAVNTNLSNWGITSGLASTVGVYGLFLKTVDRVEIDGYTGSNFNDQRNSGPGITNAYGDQPGTVRHIFLWNCGEYSHSNIFITPGSESLGDDVDPLQWLDDRMFAIAGAANNGSGLIRLTVGSTTNISTGNWVVVSGVVGTTEANGRWKVTVVDSTHLDLQSSAFANVYVSAGTVDAIAMKGSSENIFIHYNGQFRRCMKYQGGYHTARSVFIRKDPTFTAVSASTQIGVNNTNCIDWAGNLNGYLRLSESYIDATGFGLGVGNTGGLGQVTTNNVDIYGPTLNVIRHNLEHDADENVAPVGFWSSAASVGCGMVNTRIYNFVRAWVPQGSQEFALNCTFDDPRDYVFETGNTGLTGFDFIGNKIITRTPGNLSVNGRGARLNDYRSVRIYDNSLTQAGNTTHSTTLIGVIGSGATGFSRGNTAPASGPTTTPINVGTSAIINTLSNNALPAINVTSLNVDAEWSFGGSFAIWNFLRKQTAISGTTQTINQFACKEISFLYSNASGCAVTVPTAIPVGSRWTARQGGGPISMISDGTVSIVAKGGVSGVSGTVRSRGLGSILYFEMTAANECTVSGDIEPNTLTLTDATTIAWNGSALNAQVTLGGNRTMGAPTNLVKGERYTLKVIQDGTGSRTLAFNAIFKHPGGSAPTVSTGANAYDVLEYYYDGTNLNLLKSNLNYS